MVDPRLPRVPRRIRETAKPDANSGGLPPGDERFLRLKERLHQHLIGSMDISALGTLSDEDLRAEVRRAAEELCQRSSDLLSARDRELLVRCVLDETFGLGPLEPLLHDEAITDILINGPRAVYVERYGRLERTDVVFNDDRHLLQIIQRIVSRVGRRIDETMPMVDARLGDGSRINAIIPPVAIDGALVSIRRFGTRPLTATDLISNLSVTPEMIEFLSACVKARINTVISGGTGSGKTTLLNVLSSFIPPSERVATIEDAAELRLQQMHVLRMETRPANIEGVGLITTRDLVRNALRMRPDRIIIGEVRGAEALDMLQAMNTGHEGSLTTIHANNTTDALSRLEIMIGMAGLDIPLWAIRRQVASAIHLVVQVSRLLGGPRKVVRITEITGMDADSIATQDLFVFQQTGVDEQGTVQGYYRATGHRPRLLQRLQESGVRLDDELFKERALPVARFNSTESVTCSTSERRPGGTP